MITRDDTWNDNIWHPACVDSCLVLGEYDHVITVIHALIPARNNMVLYGEFCLNEMYLIAT
jgi:hypothetical protein